VLVTRMFTALYKLRLYRAYGILATSTMLSYDFLCTLDREVKYIWSSPWNPGSLLFMLNRYLPFIDTGVALYLITTETTPEICHTLNLFIIAMLNFGILISEMIIILRTYAIWNHSRPVLMLLRVLALVHGLHAFTK